MVLEDVQPGQQVARSLSASSWNLHNAAARQFMAGGDRPGVRHQPASSGVYPRNGNVIKVRNNTDSDVGQFGILGIDDLLHTPESDLNGQVMVQFRQQPWLDCVAPTQADHFANFVVLIDGITAGNIGRAAVGGVIQAKIDIKHEAHRYADVLDEDVTKLRSTGFGSSKILASEAGTGEKWAIIALSARNKLTSPIKLTGNEQINAAKFKYAWSEVVIESAGTVADVTGGMAGTTAEGWALNRREINHTGTGIVQGVDIDHDDYPDGYAPRPIDGGGDDNSHQQDVVVDAEMVDGRVWFSEAMSHDGSCS